jgi:hypothetical protein
MVWPLDLNTTRRMALWPLWVDNISLNFMGFDGE